MGCRDGGFEDFGAVEDDSSKLELKRVAVLGLRGDCGVLLISTGIGSSVAQPSGSCRHFRRRGPYRDVKFFDV